MINLCRCCCFVIITWGTAVGAAEISVQPAPDIDVEPNDALKQAVPLTLPQLSGRGCIRPAGESDVYGFTLMKPTPLLVAARSAKGRRFVLTLYDAQEATMAHGEQSLDVAQAPAGSYFVRIASVEQGCYNLEILLEVPPSRLPASR